MFGELFLLVCNMSFLASYIIVFILIVRIILKKTPRIFSYSLWSVVLFRLLCSVSFENVFSIFGVMGKTTKDLHPFPTAFSKLPETTNVTQLPNQTEVVTALQRPPFEIIYPTIWLIGVSLLVIYSVVKIIKLKKQLVGATPLRGNIFLADDIASPFVIGFIKPKIYLPSCLTADEQEYIITHEKHHIKRLDHVTRILGFIALTIHWFNPLVWVAFILSGKDMEISCDEAVMKKTDKDIRTEYSSSLLRFATGRKFITATPLAFGEGDTKRRVKNVMKYKKPVVWVSLLALVIVACVIVGLVSTKKEEIFDSSVSSGFDNKFEISFSKSATSIGVNRTILNEGDEVIVNVWSVDDGDIKVGVAPVDDQNIVDIDNFIGESITLSDEPQKISIIVPQNDVYKVTFINENKSAISFEGKIEYITDIGNLHITELWDHRTDYVGDNSSVGNIINGLTFPSKITYDYMEMQTSKEPYRLTVYFKTDPDTSAFYKNDIDWVGFHENQLILFALIGNLGEVAFNIDDGTEYIEMVYNRKTAESDYGDIFEKTEELNGFVSLLSEIYGN